MRIIDIDGHVREADDLFEKYLRSAVPRPRAEDRKSRQRPTLIQASKATAITAARTNRRSASKTTARRLTKGATSRPIPNSAWKPWTATASSAA